MYVCVYICVCVCAHIVWHECATGHLSDQKTACELTVSLYHEVPWLELLLSGFPAQLLSLFVSLLRNKGTPTPPISLFLDFYCCVSFESFFVQFLFISNNLFGQLSKTPSFPHSNNFSRLCFCCSWILQVRDRLFNVSAWLFILSKCFVFCFSISN